MKLLIRLCLSLSVFVCFTSSCIADTHPESVVITDVYATGYYCVYNSELAGSQTVIVIISDSTYTLKASFLFGGYGVVMQGTGRTSADGDYIKYTSGAGCFVRISGPSAGRNLEGQWVENPDVLRGRYALLGITDFTGFGNLALRYPDKACYSRVASFTGSSGQTLTPWHSISTDPSFIPFGQTCELLFKNGRTMPKGDTFAKFKAQDVGGAIKGRHIEIYLGEGESAIAQWNRTGGNRYVDIYLQQADLNKR